MFVEVGYLDVLNVLFGFVGVFVKGVFVVVDSVDVCLFEIYVGYVCVESFVLLGGVVCDVVYCYDVLGSLDFNGWGFVGMWNVGVECVLLVVLDGWIVYCFYVCDLYFVFGFGVNGWFVCFWVMFDGVVFGVVYGVDVDV